MRSGILIERVDSQRSARGKRRERRGSALVGVGNGRSGAEHGASRHARLVRESLGAEGEREEGEQSDEERTGAGATPGRGGGCKHGRVGWGTGPTWPRAERGYATA